MKASEAQFLDFLDGRRQFIIPIYQRTYSWTLDECDELWNDIVRTATDASIITHFVGSIVYIHHGIPTATQPAEFMVIDGQQRLTTLTLLLLALASAFQQRGDVDAADEIRERYIFNKHSKDSRRYKILLTQDDRDTLFRLLDDKEQEERASRRIITNYEFFRERLRTTGIDPDLLHQGVAKLVIVDISLDRSHDNPQLIFESLNSTGLELSQADLIRNYVLMGQPTNEMERLYRDYWLPMERRFGHIDYDSQFDRFVRDYLTLRTGRIPNIGDVYSAFKQYTREVFGGAVQEPIADIARLAKFFVYMVLCKEPDVELRSVFEDIATLKVDVAFPFMLYLYEHYDQHRLNKADFVEMLRLVESYVFRRAVCGIPTNSLNKTFASLSRDVDLEKPLESLSATLRSFTSYRRFPEDSEVERELAVKDVYNFRSRNYLLRRLENAGHKERVVIEEHTIEHIMPQNPNLSKEWQDMLGPDWQTAQKQGLHTLGNLTLTLHNGPMGDRPFRVKRDMEGDFRQTPLMLNNTLQDLDHWDAEKIRLRGAQLARLAVQVWPAPMVGPAASSPASDQQQGSYSLDTYPALTGKLRELFLRLQKYVLNLDSSITEQFNKYDVEYNSPFTFLKVTPQAGALSLRLLIPYDRLEDPTSLCPEVSVREQWDAEAAVELKLTDEARLDDVMYLVLQALDAQSEDVPV